MKTMTKIVGELFGDRLLYNSSTSSIVLGIENGPIKSFNLTQADKFKLAALMLNGIDAHAFDVFITALRASNKATS